MKQKRSPQAGLAHVIAGDVGCPNTCVEHFGHSRMFGCSRLALNRWYLASTSPLSSCSNTAGGTSAPHVLGPADPPALSSSVSWKHRRCTCPSVTRTVSHCMAHSWQNRCPHGSSSGGGWVSTAWCSKHTVLHKSKGGEPGRQQWRFNTIRSDTCNILTSKTFQSCPNSRGGDPATVADQWTPTPPCMRPAKEVAKQCDDTSKLTGRRRERERERRQRDR